MPGRDIIFQNGAIYHIFNKAIDKRRVFTAPRYCQTFLDVLIYYRSDRARVSFSHLKHNLKETLQEEIIKETRYTISFKAHIVAYCIMPTHFHLLVQQKKDDGVQKLMSNLVNSFTQYYNKSTKRSGPLFFPRFKAVQVKSDAQLMHVSRYIHLNPYSSKEISHKDEIATYPYSSYRRYLSPQTKDKDVLVDNTKVMELFNFDAQSYADFVIKNADYQQTLEQVKYVYNW